MIIWRINKSPGNGALFMFQRLRSSAMPLKCVVLRFGVLGCTYTTIGTKTAHGQNISHCGRYYAAHVVRAATGSTTGRPDRIGGRIAARSAAQAKSDPRARGRESRQKSQKSKKSGKLPKSGKSKVARKSPESRKSAESIKSRESRESRKSGESESRSSTLLLYPPH